MDWRSKFSDAEEKSIWPNKLRRACLFLEIIILIIIAMDFKTMYYVLNTSSELSGALKGKNAQIILWELHSLKHHSCKRESNRKFESFAGSTLRYRYSNSQQCCSLQKSGRALLCLFSCGVGTRNDWRDGDLWFTWLQLLAQPGASSAPGGQQAAFWGYQQLPGARCSLPSPSLVGCLLA